MGICITKRKSFWSVHQVPGHPLYFGMIFPIKSQLAVETHRDVAPSHTCSSDEDICNVVFYQFLFMIIVFYFVFNF